MSLLQLDMVALYLTKLTKTPKVIFKNIFYTPIKNINKKRIFFFLLQQKENAFSFSPFISNWKVCLFFQLSSTITQSFQEKKKKKKKTERLKKKVPI